MNASTADGIANHTPVTGRVAAHAVARMLLAVVLLAAVAQQFLWGLGGSPVAGGYPANFFSYFTIESNLIAAALLVVGAVAQLRGIRPGWLGVTAACAATYMATTGVVYNALLRRLESSGTLGSSWPNEAMHLVGPALLVIDWVLWSRGLRLRWRTLWAIASFPLLWVVYTMVRGEVTGFYPYPFLEPSQPGGWAAVAAYLVGIAVFIVGSGAVMVAISRMRPGRSASAGRLRR